MIFKSRKQPRSRQRVRTEAERPQVFSYRASRNDQEYNLGRLQPYGAADIRKKSLTVRYWRQRAVAIAAGLVILFCVLDVLHLSPSPKVVALTNSTTGYFLQPISVYQRAASTLFRKSIWNGNKVTVNTDQITATLRAEFPELSDVSITLPLMGHRAVVYVAPTTPSLLYTTNGGSTAGTPTATTTMVLDQNGIAVIAASQLSGSDALKLPTVTDVSGLALKPGKQVLSADSVHFIQTVAGELAAKGVSVASMTLPSAAYELDVYPKGAGYYVKFNMHASGSAMQQVGTFLAVQQRLKAEQRTPSQYIDVRINGRAYYK